jgi:Kef-type K+ transport system membrane component KefB
MNTSVSFLLLLGIIIAAAKIAGVISTRLGQPAVLGELLAGLLLGPTVFDLTHLAVFSAKGHPEEIVFELGELGVIFLMFIAGLEVDLDEMLHAGKVAALVGVFGVVVPLVLAVPVAQAFNFSLLTSVFIGIILTATSVSISAQTLYELGVLRSREGLALLGAAVVDDVLVILILSIFLALTGGAAAGAGDIFVIVLRMILFLGLAIFLGAKLFPRLTEMIERLPVSEGVAAFVIVMMLLFAWAAEEVGTLAAITGAFLAGLFFARTALRRTIAERMHTLAYAFFVPVFLISIGLKANARALAANEVLFAGVIIAIAILGKLIGGWLGARLGGFDGRGALRMGVGMISRGEVGLIVAAAGLNEGLITRNVYSGMVVMVLATTLITPVFLRWVFPKAEVVNG